MILFVMKMWEIKSNFLHLLKFVNAEINQVMGDTESAFLALTIASNCTTLLDADTGVHAGCNWLKWIVIKSVFILIFFHNLWSADEFNLWVRFLLPWKLNQIVEEKFWFTHAVIVVNVDFIINLI